MPPKKKKTPKKLSVQTADKDKIDFFTDTIPLPKIQHAEKYFKNFCKNCKFNRATLSVTSIYLHIAADNQEVLANVRINVEKEVKRFIEMSGSLIKIFPEKISPITRWQRKQEKLIPQCIIPTKQLRDDQHSKPVYQVLRQNRRRWNKIKKMRRQWYINRFKINAKFKAISQYFSQLSRRRHHEVSLYRQKKRSRYEYYKQKVFGRRRDRLKAKRAHRAKRKIKPRKPRKPRNYELKMGSHNNTSIYKHILNKHRGIPSQMPKLKFITVDSAKTVMLQSKKKTVPYSTMISGGLLKEEFDFPLSHCISKISIDRKKFVIRYYNQQIFIYAASINTNKPLKRNLIATFSTLNENEMESNRYTANMLDFLRSSNQALLRNRT